MKKNVLNYMECELQALPKNEVAKILVKVKKNLTLKEAMAMPKDRLIKNYIAARNKALIFG